MPKTNAQFRADFRRLRIFIGNQCCYFLNDGTQCKKRRRLEFAHLEAKTLQGRGRGKRARIRDIFSNLCNVALLCRGHHLDYDSRYYHDKLLAAGQVINVFAMTMLSSMRQGVRLRGELLIGSYWFGPSIFTYSTHRTFAFIPSALCRQLSTKVP